MSQIHMALNATEFSAPEYWGCYKFDEASFEHISEICKGCIFEAVWDPLELMEGLPKEKKLNLFANARGKGFLYLVPNLVKEEWHNCD